MLRYWLEVILGAMLLAWSANRFVDSSVSLAKYLRMPSLIIGILFVGLGTSFPEFVVALFASYRGSAELAIGNAIGSNIANIALVLGLVALITPIVAHSRLIRRELPILVCISILLGLIFYDAFLSRWEGGVLIAVFAVYLYFILTKNATGDGETGLESQSTTLTKASLTKSLMWWLLAMILLLASSELFVRGAIEIARWFNISELVIGLTIVTLGTSLPELAATLVSALKKQHDIAIGHIVGSNIFNSLMVVAVPALMHPGKVSYSILWRDYPVMLLYTLVLWLVLLFAANKQIGRFLGALFLLGYVVYLGCLAI